MNIFISWSGDLSDKIAHIFRDWIKLVIQDVVPYVSSEDIRKGVRWLNDISEKLEETRFGIIFLTPDNLEAPWILFEAGALSKSLSAAQVCPFLFGVKNHDLGLPLSQFQACEFSKVDTLKLCKSIRESLPDTHLDEDSLEKVFERFWPDFETKVNEEILNYNNNKNLEGNSNVKQSSVEELFGSVLDIQDHILDMITAQNQILGNPEKLIPREYLLEIAGSIEKGAAAAATLDVRHPAIKVMSGVIQRIKNEAEKSSSPDVRIAEIKKAADELARLLDYLNGNRGRDG